MKLEARGDGATVVACVGFTARSATQRDQFGFVDFFGDKRPRLAGVKIWGGQRHDYQYPC
jgi:hypothetical protein